MASSAFNKQRREDGLIQETGNEPLPWKHLPRNLLLPTGNRLPKNPDRTGLYSPWRPAIITSSIAVLPQAGEKLPTLHSCAIVYPLGRDQVQSLPASCFWKLLGKSSYSVDSSELLLNSSWLMLGKYLRIIITIRLHGEEKTKERGMEQRGKVKVQEECERSNHWY